MNNKIYNPFIPFIQLFSLITNIDSPPYSDHTVIQDNIHEKTNTKGSFVQTNKIFQGGRKHRRDRSGRFLSSFPSILASSRPDAPSNSDRSTHSHSIDSTRPSRNFQRRHCSK